MGKQGGDADANANARRVRLSGPWRVFEIGSGDVDDELETGNYGEFLDDLCVSCGTS